MDIKELESKLWRLLRGKDMNKEMLRTLFRTGIISETELEQCLIDIGYLEDFARSYR